MGIFINWSDITNKYPDIESIITAEEADNTYILSAESIIQGKLNSKYSVTLLQQSYLVKSLVADMVYIDIQSTRQPKKADQLKKKVDDMLRELTKGNITLTDSYGTVLSRDKSIVWSSTEDYTPPFAMDDQLDMEIDPDQVYDETEARD